MRKEIQILAYPRINPVASRSVVGALNDWSFLEGKCSRNDRHVVHSIEGLPIVQEGAWMLSHISRAEYEPVTSEALRGGSMTIQLSTRMVLSW